MSHPGCDAVRPQACHISKIAQKGWAIATLPDLMNGWQAGAPPSAMLAMRTLHAAQRFACLACLQQVLPRLALLTPACPSRLSLAPACTWLTKQAGQLLSEVSRRQLHMPWLKTAHLCVVGPLGCQNRRKVPAGGSERGGHEGAGGEGGPGGGAAPAPALLRVLHARPGAQRPVRHRGPAPGGLPLWAVTSVRLLSVLVALMLAWGMPGHGG